MMENSNLRKNLTSKDQFSLYFVVLTGLRRIENMHLQYLDGILSNDAFDRIGMSFYKRQYAKETW